MKVKKSAHLCGEQARQTALGRIDPIALSFDRIQINGIPALDISEAHKIIFRKFKNIDFIFQCKTGFFKEPYIYQLFDCSGGRGLLPTSVPEVHSDKLVGYAGGMGPDTVEHYLSLIKAKQYWIDMETHIRTDGWFDLGKCRRVCELIWG